MVQTAFTIRKADQNDSSAVTELLRASYPTLMKSAYDSAMLAPALDLMTRANPKLLSSGTFYVAESENGNVVGCGGWTREAPGGHTASDGLGHIRHFGTHPDWTRKGIGRAIFRKCEEEASASGIHGFECYSSLNAECFYAALGFERIGLFEMQMDEDISLTGCHMRYRF